MKEIFLLIVCAPLLSFLDSKSVQKAKKDLLDIRIFQPYDGYILPKTGSKHVIVNSISTEAVAVEIYIDGILIKHCETQPAICGFDWLTNKVAAGSHIIKAIAHGVNNNIAIDEITVIKR